MANQGDQSLGANPHGPQTLEFVAHTADRSFQILSHRLWERSESLQDWIKSWIWIPSASGGLSHILNKLYQKYGWVERHQGNSKCSDGASGNFNRTSQNSNLHNKPCVMAFKFSGPKTNTLTLVHYWPFNSCRMCLMVPSRVTLIIR